MVNNPLPQLRVSGNSPYEQVLQRADTLLSGNTTAFLLSFKEVVQHPEKYFVINYVSEEQYLDFGHLEGAIRFTPRQPLVSDDFLSSLPTDKAIVVYCHTGHQSAHLTAYLRMLGYDAHSIFYGANSFMHSALTKSKSMNHYWSEAQKNDFPVTTGQNTNDQSAAPFEIKAVQGGC
jgi:rhodanese-related sulfurtransferase